MLIDSAIVGLQKCLFILLLFLYAVERNSEIKITLVRVTYSRVMLLDLSLWTRDVFFNFHGNQGQVPFDLIYIYICFFSQLLDSLQFIASVTNNVCLELFGMHHRVFLYRGFLSEEECDHLVTFLFLSCFNYVLINRFFFFFD